MWIWITFWHHFILNKQWNWNIHFSKQRSYSISLYVFLGVSSFYLNFLNIVLLDIEFSSDSFSFSSQFFFQCFWTLFFIASWMFDNKPFVETCCFLVFICNESFFLLKLSKFFIYFFNIFHNCFLRILRFLWCHFF
jgi:hypothetical protein